MSHTSNAFFTLSNKLCSLVFAATVAVMGNNALAQVFEETVPTKPTAAAFQMPAIAEVEMVDVAKLNMADIANEDLIRAARVEAPRYAIPNPVKISPATGGTWENVIDQAGALRRVWRLRVGCENAVSMNLGFTEYHLPRGAALYIYTPDFAHMIRPFTEADNADHGQLWTPPLPGNEIVIELTVERDLEREVQLTLGSINAGYLNFSAIANALDKSQSCNVDVVCSQGDAWRDEISTVAAISTGGSLFCSGFMVNNVRQDLTPYFMTAFHCGITTSNAASLVAFWNYENSTCRTPGSSASSLPGNGALTKFTTGSTFKAASSATDFTLVRLTSSPNPAWNVNFAGWNANRVESTSQVGIHHPNCQEKRICFDNNPSTTTSVGGSTSPGAGTHLRVGQWEVGTTEPGSSGSPIFNQLHQVVGQLHGGTSSCTSITSDWYGRFSVSWLGGGTAATGLKTWLDPDNTGILSVNTLGVMPPTIISINPNSGSILGGTEFTITGTNLTGARSVTVNGVAATSVVVVSATSITAITPAGTVGAKNVAVTTPSGTANKASGFTYVFVECASSINIHPFTNGSSNYELVKEKKNWANAAACAVERGGFLVQIDSSAEQSAVYDAILASGVSSHYNDLDDGGGVSYIWIGATDSKAEGAWLWDGTNSGFGFNFWNGQGAAGNNTGATVQGSYVNWGRTGINSGSFQEPDNYDNSQNAAAIGLGQWPSGAPFVYGNPGQWNDINTANTNYYIIEFPIAAGPPIISMVSPASGTTSGGTTFAIAGTNLNGATSVTVDGVAATIVFINTTCITARTPAGTLGVKNVAVTTPRGTATKASAFTYTSPAPTITAISPTSGTTLGGTAITITGTNFTGATSVKVDGVAATSVVVLSATSITARTPAAKSTTSFGNIGAKSVTVTTPKGTATKANGFIYVALPTITSVSPSSGVTLGGTAFTITGTNLTGATSVKVNGVAATSVAVVSATKITAKTPAGTAGAKSVAVTTANGTATKAGAFTYLIPVPTVSSVVPGSGPTRGGTVVTFTGTYLSGATLTIDGIPIEITYNTGTSFKIIAPAHSSGCFPGILTTSYGSLNRQYMYCYYVGLTGDQTNGGRSINRMGMNLDGGEANASEESIPLAPMGVQLYLQTIITQPDVDVDCANTQSSDAPDAPAATVEAIDLDHNGEADICQLRDGDLDLNGVIDNSDMGILLDMIGVEPLHGIGDMDANGVIDSADMGLLLLKIE